MTNSDVKITIFNRTPSNYTMIVFQQDPEINGMFTKLFPTAWQQIPLGGLRTADMGGGNASYDCFTYPIQMQVGVSENDTPYKPNFRTTTVDCALNSKWSFSIENLYQHLTLKDDVNVDGTISCYNDSSKKVDISICKNNKPLLVYRGQDGKGVPQGEVANLKITPKLYIMYAAEMRQTSLFSSYVSSNEVIELDLTNTREIDLALTVKDQNSGLKEWVIERRQS